MESVRNGLNRLVDVIFAWIPSLLGALIVLLVGLMVAGAVRKLVKKLLGRVGLDQRLHTGSGGNFIQRAVPSPSNLIGDVLYWVFVLAVVSLAATILGIDMLNHWIDAIVAFVPQVLAALLIFLVASAISAGVGVLINNTMGDTPTGKIVGTMAPVIIMGIAAFMILDQLGIAENIVTITYAALVGSAALGTALAFGLGGREVAADMLGNTYRAVRENAGQVRRDAAVGKARAQDQAENLKRRQR